MADDTDNPLALATFEDLVEEIKRRSDYGAICFMVDRTETEEHRHSDAWGGAAAIGAADYILEKTKIEFGPVRPLLEAIYEFISGDAEDGEDGE